MIVVLFEIFYVHIYLLGMSSARAASKRACNLDISGTAFYIRHW